MKKQKNEKYTVDVPALEAELKRVNLRIRFRTLLKSTVYTLIVTAAVAVLIAVFFMPVFRIYGSSMQPTLNEGQIVVSVKSTKVKRGDIVGVWWGSKLLVKRCIATAGDVVDIDEEGSVFVNGERIDEPYLVDKAKGDTNIELPCRVPEHTVFVMGDKRSTSIDSRNTSVGCVDLDDIGGILLFSVWPFSSFGSIE